MYFFRSANPKVEQIFDSQTIGNSVAKYLLLSSERNSKIEPSSIVIIIRVHFDFFNEEVIKKE